MFVYHTICPLYDCCSGICISVEVGSSVCVCTVTCVANHVLGDFSAAYRRSLTWLAGLPQGKPHSFVKSGFLSKHQILDVFVGALGRNKFLHLVYTFITLSEAEVTVYK